jgi:hypothetical protein
VAIGPDGALYITSERDNERNKSCSWNVVLRYDVSTVTAATTELAATHQWDVHSFVPTGSNLGLEGIAYVPDSFLVDSGWKVGGTAYTAATQPTPGLFVTAVEGTGDLHFFSLPIGAAPVEVKVEKSGFPWSMDVAYDSDRKALWALCDDSCGGVYNLLTVEGGDFAVQHSYARPAGMPNLNNEGLAIAPWTTAVDGKVEVIWADDGDTDGYSLRAGALALAPAVTPEPEPEPQPQPTDPILEKPTPTPTPALKPVPVPKRPTVTGPRKVGSTVVARVVRLPKGAKVSYRWTAGGKAVKGGKKRSLRLTRALRGKRIVVTITISKPGFKTVTKKVVVVKRLR